MSMWNPKSRSGGLVSSLYAAGGIALAFLIAIHVVDSLPRSILIAAVIFQIALILAASVVVFLTVLLSFSIGLHGATEGYELKGASKFLALNLLVFVLMCTYTLLSGTQISVLVSKFGDIRGWSGEFWSAARIIGAVVLAELALCLIAFIAGWSRRKRLSAAP